MTRRVESAIGVVDGVNASFAVSVPYKPGTLAAYLNGQLIFGDYAETDPDAGEFVVVTASAIPQPDGAPWGPDSLTAEYDDRASGSTESISAVVQGAEQVVGTIDGDAVVVGAVADGTAVSGIVATDTVTGVVAAEGTDIVGVVE